jgi:diacylglycerol kinase
MSQFKNKNIFIAIRNSLFGLRYILKHHRHFQIEILFALLAIFLGYLFKLSLFEFLFIILAIFLVLITEIINSIIEDILDFVNPEYDEKIKVFKDVSAGVVLVAVIFSLIIGALIFGSKLFLPIF